MDLTARDINEMQFHDAWRGYNQEEVDDFLDRVAETVDRLQRETHALRTRMNELEQAVSTSREAEEMLKKTLVTAQQAAEEAIGKAKAKAEALVREAEERARRSNEELQERIASSEAEIRRRALDADREHQVRTRQVDASIGRLRGFSFELQDKLRAFLEDQQRLLASGASLLEEQLRALEELSEPEPPAALPVPGGEATPEARGALDPGADRAPEETIEPEPEPAGDAGVSWDDNALEAIAGEPAPDPVPSEATGELDPFEAPESANGSGDPGSPEGPVQLSDLSDLHVEPGPETAEFGGFNDFVSEREAVLHADDPDHDDHDIVEGEAEGARTGGRRMRNLFRRAEG